MHTAETQLSGLRRVVCDGLRLINSCEQAMRVSFAPFGARLFAAVLPGACAPGCILAPLRGCVTTDYRRFRVNNQRLMANDQSARANEIVPGQTTIDERPTKFP